MWSALDWSEKLPHTLLEFRTVRAAVPTDESPYAGHRTEPLLDWPAFTEASIQTRDDGRSPR